jgi:hypothetical protein
MTAPAQPARDLAWAVALMRDLQASFARLPGDDVIGYADALRLLLGAAEDAGRLREALARTELLREGHAEIAAALRTEVAKVSKRAAREERDRKRAQRALVDLADRGHGVMRPKPLLAAIDAARAATTTEGA